MVTVSGITIALTAMIITGICEGGRHGSYLYFLSDLI